MKKIFTLLLTTVAMLSASSVKADQITLKIDTYDSTTGDYVTAAKDCTSTFYKEADGTYTIDNFLNSGQAVSFKYGDFDSKNTAKVEITSKTYVHSSKSYPYFYAGGYMYSYLTSPTDEEIDLEMVYYYNKTKDYPTVYKYSDADAAQIGYQYYFQITVEGYIGDAWSPTYTVSFYFNEPEERPVVKEIGKEDITISVYDQYNVTFKSVNTTLTYFDDGSYTIADFLNSGAPLSFKFDAPEVDKTAAMTFIDNVEVDGMYVDVIAPDESYASVNLETEAGEATTVYYYYIYNDSDGYTYVENTNSTKKYSSTITFIGFTDTENWKYTPYYYAYFDFNGPTQSGIAKVVAEDNDAPVEYYNLNGIRVDNPANGIYIRKQGNDVKKVVIR